MKHTFTAVLLLVATYCSAAEPDDRRRMTSETSSPNPSAHLSDASDTEIPDSAEGGVVATDSYAADEIERTAVDEQLDSDADSKQQDLTEQPITLDELIRQIRQTPNLQNDTLHQGLAERRRLAISLRSTLEAAKQVADFGEAGTQLLHDASLETIVATMIAEQERERLEQQALAAPATLTAVEKEPADTADTAGFDVWHPVYVVRDAHGHRVGWRHSISGERINTYVGETETFGDDTVTVLGVSNQARGRVVLVDVNDKQREVDLY